MVAQRLNVPGDASYGEIRQALVIGNNKHPTVPLANPVNDARAMQRALGDLGFEVTLVADATGVEMQRQLQAFLKGIKKDSVVVIFFAGHGVEIDGLNYLIPSDLVAEDEFDVKDKAVNVSALLARLEQSLAKVRLLILDACRDNPFVYAAQRGIAERGLAAPQGEVTGSFVAFSTAAGRVARDSAPGDTQGRTTSSGNTVAPASGRGNSVFTAALVNELANKTPGATLDQVFNRVRLRVADQTEKKQVPFSSSGLVGDWFPFGQATKPEPGENQITASRNTLENAGRLIASGDLTKALGNLNDAVSFDWKNAEAYNYRGLLYSMSGKHTDELNDFSEATRVDPSNYLGFLNLGLALKGTGDCIDAIENFDKAAERAEKAKVPGSERAAIYRYRAACWSDVGSYDKAEEDLQRFAVLGGE